MNRIDGHEKKDESTSKITGDWHERGEYPPVGTVCEHATMGQNNWRSGTIIAYYEGCVWISGNGIHRLSSTQFRPLQTERERWVKAAQLAIDMPLDYAEMLGEIYDAGLAKMPEDK